MAILTAEDVLNKAFSKTKYREGFDQDEVDDFLDEVANSISALTAERDELQSRLSQYQAGGVPAAPTAAVSEDGAQASSTSSSADLLAAATDPNPPSATTMLSMAQRLHDDYVQAGESERERIIDEGKAKAESIVGEGKAKAESIVEQAEKDAQVRLQTVDAERVDLERRIDDLRRFERDYRGHLRNYLENLLGDLEHNSAPGPAGAFDAEAVAVPTGESAPAPFAETMTELAPESFEAESFPEAPTEPESQTPESHASEPFAPAEFSPREYHSSGEDSVAPVIPTFAVPDALPAFPAAAEAEPAFGSPFAEANPFAPTPVQPVVQANDDANASDESTPDEEAPRWNF